MSESILITIRVVTGLGLVSFLLLETVTLIKKNLTFQSQEMYMYMHMEIYMQIHMYMYCIQTEINVQEP